MGLGIYKHGKGYWVRTMTAIAAGVLTFATAAWVWQQMTRVEAPTIAFDIRVQAIEGELPGVGDSVLLTQPGDPTVNPAPVAYGSAAVQEVITADGVTRLRIEEPTFAVLTEPPFTAVAPDLRTVGSARGVITEGESFSAVVPNTGGVQPVRMFPQIYIQAGAAGLALLIGGGLTYWLVGSKPRTAEFLIDTDAEMRRVNWSTKREIKASTATVIVASLLIAVFLTIVDLMFKTFFEAIGVLDLG